MAKLIAITGGTGFIGRALYFAHLARGDAVRILTRSHVDSLLYPNNVSYYRADLFSVDDLTPFVNKVDVLYHCAGELRNKYAMHNVHVLGTNRLMMAASGRIGRWVQLSSVGVYGRQQNGFVDECAILNPCGVYEVTKNAADDLLVKAALNNHFELAVLRPSIVYGPDMSNQSLFQLIRMIDKGLFFYIGSPGATANYVHVGNVVDALMLAAGSPLPENGRAYIVSDHCTMEEFVAMIAEALGRKPPRLRLPEGPVRLAARLCEGVPGFPLTTSRIDALTNRVVYSSRRIEQELGYRHRITMADGIGELVRAWKHANK